MLEETLFYFLLSVRDRQPQAVKPLIAENVTLHALYTEAHPDLWKALCHCLDAFLIELTPDPAQWGKLQVPTAALGLTLALHNSLVPVSSQQPGDEEKQTDLLEEFTTALVASLPPARERDAALVYHSVLYGTESTLRQPETERARLLHTLIELSPLTALWLLDMHTPAALNDLAAELLTGWRKIDRSQGNVWREAEEWLDVVCKLLADARIARWLRRRWLTMPETRQACRNVGLLLEALRRRGGQREFILEFYEAYDYFCANTKLDEWGKQVRVWPILETIDKLLRVPGDSEAVIRVNRWGNEYFLKFRSLIEIVIAENGIPSDYALLNWEFAWALRPILDYITENVQQRISFGEVVFS